jgi:hypothetical protein
MRKYILALILLGLAVACGDGNGGTEPVNADVTGTWALTLSPISGHGLTCQITGLNAELVQSGTDVSGTYTADDMVCNGQHSGPMSGTIVNGENRGGRLHFHFDVEEFDLHGALTSTDRAIGDYTIVLDLDSQQYTFRGTWSGTRM